MPYREVHVVKVCEQEALTRVLKEKERDICQRRKSLAQAIERWDSFYCCLVMKCLCKTKPLALNVSGIDIRLGDQVRS